MPQHAVGGACTRRAVCQSCDVAGCEPVRCVHVRPAGVVGSEAVHLLALCEAPEAQEGAQGVELPSQSDRAHFGIAFLDAAAGRFYIGSASDDAGRASLGAILMQAHTPSLCGVQSLGGQITI